MTDKHKNDPSPYTPYYRTPLGYVKEVRMNSHIPRSERVSKLKLRKKERATTARWSKERPYQVIWPGHPMHRKWHTKWGYDHFMKQKREHEEGVREVLRKEEEARL